MISWIYAMLRVIMAWAMSTIVTQLDQIPVIVGMIGTTETRHVFLMKALKVALFVSFLVFWVIIFAVIEALLLLSVRFPNLIVDMYIWASSINVDSENTTYSRNHGFTWEGPWENADNDTFGGYFTVNEGPASRNRYQYRTRPSPFSQDDSEDSVSRGRRRLQQGGPRGQLDFNPVNLSPAHTSDFDNENDWYSDNNLAPAHANDVEQPKVGVRLPTRYGNFYIQGRQLFRMDGTLWLDHFDAAVGPDNSAIQYWDRILAPWSPAPASDDAGKKSQLQPSGNPSSQTMNQSPIGSAYAGGL